MWNHLVSFICATFVLTGSALASDLMTRGMTITGGQNASAGLKLERVNESAGDDRMLTLRLTLSQARDLKGYGLTLQYAAAKYELLEAREPDTNLLKAGPGQETLFLTSNRTPGELHIGAMKVDGGGAAGDGTLVELVFQATDTPSASDFQVSESVLIGVDGAVDLLSHAEVGDLTPLPDRFNLDQNAPNPFNPSTVIGYQLAEAGEVRLVIYNLLGQGVRVLVNERQEAGSFRATWDGMDEMGRRVASGVYLYRIQAGAFTSVRRMVLLK